MEVLHCLSELSLEELEANIQIDHEYQQANNPLKMIDSIDKIDVSFLVEVGEKDELDAITFGKLIKNNQEFISKLQAKGISVKGGVVPAAESDEPDNGGNAMHGPSFQRTRLGGVLKFFSDVHRN